jgi:hypothetical protein
MSDNINDSSRRSGGNAAAGGMAFQANVAAHLSLGLLSERPVDQRLDLGDAKAVSIRCETEAPVDDVLLETSQGGFVFVQAKTSIDLSPQLSSGFGSAVQQAVRLWIACSEGKRGRRWDRPLDLTKDRILFAIGPTSAASISETLSVALQRYRDSHSGDPTLAQAGALDRFGNLVSEAWRRRY